MAHCVEVMVCLSPRRPNYVFYFISLVCLSINLCVLHTVCQFYSVTQFFSSKKTDDLFCSHCIFLFHLEGTRHPGTFFLPI